MPALEGLTVQDPEMSQRVGSAMRLLPCYVNLLHHARDEQMRTGGLTFPHVIGGRKNWQVSMVAILISWKEFVIHL